MSIGFAVIPYGPTIQDHGETEYGTEMGKYSQPTAPFEDNHPHHFHEVFHRVQCSYHLRPSGHAIYRSKQSTHEDEHHHEEKHDKHGLLLGICVGGNQKSEAQYCQQVYPDEYVHGQYIALRKYAIDYP